MSVCERFDVEGFVLGELSGTDERRLEQHLIECDGCRDEMAWLRRERSLFADRSVAGRAPSFEALIGLPRAHAWSAVAASDGIVDEPRRVRRRPRRPQKAKRSGQGLFAAVAAAAMAYAIFGTVDRVAPNSTPSPDHSVAKRATPKPLPNKRMGRAPECPRPVQPTCPPSPCSIPE